MTTNLVPGIYRAPQAQPHPRLGLVRTDIAGFVGMAERGPLDKAVRLTSWEEYRRTFGGFQRFGYLPFAVRGFFENGGTECYAVRVARQSGSEDQLPATSGYTLSGGLKVKGQITLTAAAPAGASTIQISGGTLVTGSVLRFAVSEEIAVVQSVGPGETINLTKPLDQTYSTGAVAHWVEGSVLAADAARGETQVTLADALAMAPGELITLTGLGIQQSLPVWRVSGTTLYLRGSIASAFASGTPVLVHQTALSVTAASPGSWGNRIRVQLTPIEDVTPRVNINITLAPGPEGGSPQREFLRRLLWDETLPASVEQSSNLIRVAQPSPTWPVVLECLLVGGADGVDGLTKQDYVGDPDESDQTKWYGLRLLEDQDDVAIVAMPDAVYLKSEAPLTLPPVTDPCSKADIEQPVVPNDLLPEVEYKPEEIYGALLAHCDKLRYRVAVLDSPSGIQARRLTDWAHAEFPPMQRLAKWGALYYPWLTVPNPLADARLTLTIPPSGHVAGFYARIDQTIGVHQPPANGELRLVSDLSVDVTDIDHADLNESGIDVIRRFPGRGIRVWGARSLSSESNWKYMHARRLMSYVEKSIEIAMQWTVFESNDFPLRRTLVHMLSEFLTGIWQKGGLKGARPEQGFYVRCDETNNSQSAIDAGQIVCEVGIAIPAPMEFLTFEIRLGAGSVQVKET